MRPDKQNINFASKEVVNYSAIANKAKSLSDGIRSIDFDRINDSIVFNSSLVHNRPKIHVKPSNNSVNNVSELNFNDNSTLTGITSDSSNTDPTKALSANILTDLNSRFKALEDKTQNQTASANETTFTGNVTADTFNGYNVGFNKTFPSILTVESNGLTNISKYLDFHWLNYQSSCRLAFDDLNLTCNRSITAPNLKSNNETRLAKAEKKNTEQDTRLDALESKDIAQDERLGSIEAMDTAQNETLNNINTKNTEQDTRLTNIETKNTEQDGRLDELEVSKLTVVHHSTNASINVVCLDSLDEYIYRPRFKVSIIFEDSEYYPSFTSENTLLASYIVKLKIINNNTLYTLKKNIYSREVDGKVEISGSNMIILNWVIQKGRIDINLTDDGSQPVIILGINDQNYYPNALIQYPVVDNYLVSKNLAHDNEERLTAATNKNTEQDTRLDTIETTTIPSITTDISNLQKADGILHEESVRYYDYSREHIEEIENTKIPAINTKNNEQDTRLSKLESKIASLLNSIYPVGSIYLSLTKSPPSLGGTWELIDEGKFLYSTTTTSGETGGSLHHVHKTSGHVLTVGEMPMHKHTFNGNKISGTVSDIAIYDGKGMKKENPTGCFSWEKYGSQTWQGQSSNNAGLKISFTATPTGSISYEGNNQAHTHGDTEAEYHIPPYITCFMYKRTA